MIRKMKISGEIRGTMIGNGKPKKMTATKLRGLLTVAKKFHVKRLKIADFEVEFIDAEYKRVGVPLDSIKDDPPAKQPTEEQMLYWSTDYDPEEDKEPQFKTN